MIELKRSPLFDSRIPPFPRILEFLSDLKSYVNALTERCGVEKRFIPRLYTYADYVHVVLYALINDRCIDWAAETLNAKMVRKYRKKYKRRMKIFRDGLRRRRLVPHQTDVNKFLRLLTEKEVHFIFGNLLSALNKRIQKELIGGSKMRFMVDNTEYGYYGKPTPPFDIGTRKKQGTKKCRIFQGHAMQGCGMTLFNEFRILRLNQYRSLHIPDSIKWLKHQGFNISYTLVDREFYRKTLVMFFILPPRGFL